MLMGLNPLNCNVVIFCKYQSIKYQLVSEKKKENIFIEKHLNVKNEI